MVKDCRPVEEDTMPGQKLSNVSFNVPKTGNLDRERRSLDDEDSSVLVSAEDGASKTLRPRSYQLEMLEQSLQRNIIIAVEPRSQSSG